MAGVATGAVIDEVLDSLVLVRHGRLVTVLVTHNAGEDRVVGRIGVAVGTGGPLALVRTRVDWEPGVVEGGAAETGRRVTGIACRRESRRHVVRIRRRGVLRFVATVAIFRRALEHVVHVTRAAGHGCVCAG